MLNYEAFAKIEQRGETSALCTIVSAQGSTPRGVGTKMLVYENGGFDGTIGGGELESRVIKEAVEAILERKPRKIEYKMTDPARGDPGVCGGTLEVYIEPILPTPTVVVVGAGHVGRAVVDLAKWLNYRVVLTDDRPEFSNPEAVPGADEYLVLPLADIPAEVNIHSSTYLILTTRNVMVDVAGLPALLETNARYIGVIGSKRRWATTEKKLIESGLDPSLLKRVISPMGLEINAETPEEIAVSIFAEIIMLDRGGDGSRMLA